MTPEQFKRLVQRGECGTIDLKQEFYLTDARGKLSLLKDVTCMANTPRDGSGHILFGVSDSGQIVGMGAQPDDVWIVDQVSKGALDPAPSVTYHGVEVDGKPCGVIEIRAERAGPVLPTKNMEGGFDVGRIWLRRSSKNVPANHVEMAACIDWFHGGSIQVGERYSDAWHGFVEAVNDFAEDQSMILVAEPLRDGIMSLIAGIGLAPWNAVIDFDYSSKGQGLHHAASAAIGSHRSLHLVRKGDRPNIHKKSSTYWYFARGMEGSKDPVVSEQGREWTRKYGKETDDQLLALSKALSPTVATCVVLWSGHEYQREIRGTLDAIEKAFGDEARFAFVTPDAGSVDALASEYDGEVFEMRPEDLGSGVLDFIKHREAPSAARCAVPTSSGAPHDLDPNDRLWMEEELEIVHLNVGHPVEGQEQAAVEADLYRKGGAISWRNLSLNHDCERELFQRIYDRVNNDLENRRTTRVNLVHAPGAGGTTLAKRVLWGVHRRFPSLVLHKLSPEETAARLAKLAGLTGNSLCLLVDGSEHQQSAVDELYETVKANQVPVVIFQALRQFAMPDQTRDRQRTFHLRQHLDLVELDRFADVYAAAVPSRSREIHELKSESNKGTNAQTPFYFGLTAYGKEFRGLTSYVRDRIGSVQGVQRKVLMFLALSHHYGQQALPEQAFASVLGLTPSRRVKLGEYLSEESRELLVREDSGEWRTAHEILAEEILHELLSPEDPSLRHLWNQSLRPIATEFAHFLRGKWQTIGERLAEIAQRVFVFRDSASLIGTEQSSSNKFSRLLEDIPDGVGRLNILRDLASVFPEEAHFHAHLGRVCGLEGRHDEALRAIDQAIALRDRDPLLHHMRGMIFRYKAEGLVKDHAAMAMIIDQVELASDAFAKSREIGRQNEHAYISEVQLIIRVLGYAAKQSGQEIQVYAYSPSAHPYLRECLERAEDLLDQLRDRRRGETRSNYETDCRAKLDAMYGDYSRAREGWDNLLGRSDVRKGPVRRQIVWSVIRQARDDWKSVEKKRVRRCVNLLEDNLSENPDDNTSIRLWLRAVRHLKHPPSIEGVIERVSHWRANSGSLDASFYLFVLHSLLALDGSRAAAADAGRALEECKALARYRRDRTRSFEWLGNGEGPAQLKHQSELGEWDEEASFYPRTSLLRRVSGLVQSLDAAQKGQIETRTGLPVFFVPGRTDLERGRDENIAVDFYLGFSYEGLRAWDVVRSD